MNEPRISTPASTGGAGHTFEQHVAAYWLAQLLVRGTPPILIDCSVIEVRLQTEYLGWRTDDFLIIGQDSAGKRRQLIGQVKRKFTVSAANDGFRKAIGDFWSDFTNDELFSANTSRFVLVTQRGTDSLLEHFVGLLDCARAASDGADFGQRLAKPGFISNRAAGYCAQVREVVGAIEGRPFTDAEIWPLLRCLHVLNLDLQTSTRQIEALIKSLLAHTVEHLDGTGAAEKAWDTLLAIASDGMATARSFRRSDLPDALTQCHRAIDGREHEALRALKEHTETVLNGIRSTIGNEFHLPRAGLVQNVLQPLESTQIVLVSGPAGSGKSVVARGAVDVLAADHFVFGFRAEEFAQPHLDATLQNGQIPVNSAVLSAILASQDRKVLLIESVERLLETTTRDAFSDLLRLASADTTLRIVLTCRDYSTGLVHTSLLASMPREHAVIEVPPLSDIELVAVERSLPALARPLANPSLRLLLSNPYFLDKALQVSWTSDRPLPESQRELRAHFWCQVVRAEDRSVAGMPQRRNDSFQQIALRRARALTAYVSCEGLDPGVVDSLRHDSLIVSSDQDPVLVAPAHDVLEDWALLEWIDHQSTKSDSSFRTLAEAIGTHPAVRRAYRIWVAELIDRDAEAADRLFQSSATEQDISAQFRDDTLVSLLRASSSPSILERHVTELLANDKDLLKRVIHLLRVACVTTPSWLPDDVAPASVLNVPEGAAWAAVLRIVQIHIPMFTAPERPLMLAFINDWANGVAVWSPYPAGAESAAAIAHRLLPDLEMHSHAEAGHQALTVIAKIPLADATRFETLLRGANDDELDSMADEFRDIVFAGLDGNPAARDLPDLLVAVASDYLLCSEADLQHREYYGTSMELESSFGMKNQLYHKYYPPSAYRGPWLRLLRDHPGKGLGFLIEVINHSADWYAHPRVSERVESPFEIELAFADGTSQKQWCSSRLWQWYRGLSVGPDALLSLLMTLERWIFESAKAKPSELDKTLLNLLQKSDSAAVTAVVASIATAFPHSSSETLLVLLSSRPCIQLDSERAVTESVSPPGWSTSLAWHGASDMVYQAERKEANALPHRNYDLERAILNLQSGPHAARVQAVLDQYRDALPPSLEQNDDDRLWRLALHRMDVRKYSATEVDAAKFEEGSETSSVERPRALRLDWDELESDVKAMVERRFTESESPNARIELLTWASNVFEKRESGLYDPRHWKQQLDRARSPDVTGADELDVARGGPGFIAAVCVRDHWLEMSPDERDWCVDMVWSEVVRPTYSWDWGNRIQLNMTSADRPCASILPLLIDKQLTALQEGRAREAFATALMHPVDEVRQRTAQAVAEKMSSVYRELMVRCVNALAMEATLVDSSARADRKRPFDQRREGGALAAEAASTVRQRFWQSDGIPQDAHQNLEIREWFGAEANARILAILSAIPNDALAVAAFGRTACAFVDWWNSSLDRSRDRGGAGRQRNYRAQSLMSHELERFLMRTSVDEATEVLRPLLEATDRHPDKVHEVLRGLTSLEAADPNTQHFWAMWELFADKVRRATWLSGLEAAERPYGNEMVSAIFLGSDWQEEIRHWRSLEGHAHRVHGLFEDLPPCAVVLDDYVRFLYYIGEQSLPDAFPRIAKRLQSGDARRMLGMTNTVFMLEVLLQRHVYGRALALKRESPMRDAIIFLLDVLVEQGSSAAFRMRDDFVTPLPAT